jgi:predicted ATPase
VITIENGECKVKPGKELILPGTIRQLITSKVDKLTGRQRDILKVASVIGKTFSVQLLTELLPELHEIDEVRLSSFPLSSLSLFLSSLISSPQSSSFKTNELFMFSQSCMNQC